MLSKLQTAYWSYAYLLRTQAPWWLMTQRRVNHRRLVKAEGSLSEESLEAVGTMWRSALKSRRFDVDWFSARVPSWVALLDQTGIYALERPRCLEIGSWQGMSSLFLLSHLRNSVVTCVDTWEGSPEHSGPGSVEKSVVESIEERFDENLAEFADRVTKFRGPSLAFFAQCSPDERYDFIYVDGSHHSDDVLCDAVLAFRLLATGGVMVFDDYLWRFFDTDVQNPAAAIHSFLRLKRRELKVVAVGEQMVIQKT